MISLSRHIELLLLDHNCVIVPGLGGFIANTASAVYNGGSDGDKLFIPPYRNIGFNPQLQVNDGLLVQSYMQAYDASYPAAYLQMEKDIELLNSHLNLFGEYNLEGIGILHKSLGQSITLTSPTAGILTPSLYGTYSFSIKSVTEVERERKVQEATNQTNLLHIQTEGDLKIEETKKEETKKAKKISHKKVDEKKHNYLIDFSIAAAASIILFIAFLAPSIRDMKMQPETVVAGTMPTVAKSKDEVKTNAEKKNPDTKVNNTGNNTEAKIVEETGGNAASVPEQAKEKNFTIVLASFVSEKNSNVLISNLASQGFGEAKFIKKGKTSRVIYSSYATEEEAISSLLDLRKQNEAFAEAWTLKLN